jgi:hypothetical protein
MYSSTAAVLMKFTVEYMLWCSSKWFDGEQVHAAMAGTEGQQACLLPLLLLLLLLLFACLACCCCQWLQAADQDCRGKIKQLSISAKSYLPAPCRLCSSNHALQPKQ